ncbi:Nn.00g025870.m01.CDS01 [Neocucurbitaria sp. VM-36]
MTPDADADADAIASCVLRTFDQLPDKRKPRPRTDGSREWVPLAGIVLSKGNRSTCTPKSVRHNALPESDIDLFRRTGMKCLPSNKLALAHGNILHDWHAEVLAIRAFNRYLLDQCLLLSTPPYPTSDFLRQRSSDEQAGLEQHPFAVRDGVSIHMYCSEAPCGDASMELVMDAQEDATPWTSAPPTVASASASSPDITGVVEEAALRGRSNFSVLGAVRCKPSRPDAPPTLSKSCTDKLALHQATSLLSSTNSLLISPKNAYIDTLVLPSSQLVPQACERAFSRSGRLKALTDDAIKSWKGGYRFHPFKVRPTSREFAWSRRCIGPAEKAVPSNLSAVSTPSWQETLIGGVLQGRKQIDPRGASQLCRRNMWRMALQVVGALGVPILVDALRKAAYKEVKEDGALANRRQTKEDTKNALKGWVRNVGDDGFSYEDPQKP